MGSQMYSAIDGHLRIEDYDFYALRGHKCTSCGETLYEAYYKNKSYKPPFGYFCLNRNCDVLGGDIYVPMVWLSKMKFNLDLGIERFIVSCRRTKEIIKDALECDIKAEKEKKKEENWRNCSYGKAKERKKKVGKNRPE